MNAEPPGIYYKIKTSQKKREMGTIKGLSEMG